MKSEDVCRSEAVQRVLQWLRVLFGVLGFKYLDWPPSLFSYRSFRLIVHELGRGITVGLIR